jgi:hypothetical protein
MGLIGLALILAAVFWVLFAEDDDGRLLLILLRRLAHGLL